MGIGTTSPSSKLEVLGLTRTSSLHVGSSAALSSPSTLGNMLEIKGFPNYGGGLFIHLIDLLKIENGNGKNVLRATNLTGELYIGDFSGTGSQAVAFLGDGNHYIKSSFGKGVSIGTYGATDAIFLREGSGKVGIGVGLNHTFGEGKLEVNGTVRAKKFVAELSGWPDYVFASNYELMPLSDVQAFIDSNSHLPGIPSAEEIEANGIDLAALAKLQMQKIEELTLYLIEVENRLSKCELK